MSIIGASYVLKDDESVKVTFICCFIRKIDGLRTALLVFVSLLTIRSSFVSVPTHSIDHAAACIRTNVNIILEVDSDIQISLLDDKD